MCYCLFNSNIVQNNFIKLNGFTCTYTFFDNRVITQAALHETQHRMLKNAKTLFILKFINRYICQQL